MNSDSRFKANPVTVAEENIVKNTILILFF